MVDWRTPPPPARHVRVVGGSTPLEALTLPPFLKRLTPSTPRGEDRRSPAPPGQGGQSPAEIVDGLRRAVRMLHYSRCTERSFLSHLALDDGMSTATQNQALAALLFLFRHVFGRQMSPAEGVVRARTEKRLPAVLSR